MNSNLMFVIIPKSNFFHIILFKLKKSGLKQKTVFFGFFKTPGYLPALI